MSRSRRPVMLALRALGLGDLLTAVPALRALAEAFPEHRRVLAAPSRLAPLAALTGAVDVVLDARPLAPVALDVAPDVAVNLHGRGPESHHVLLATRPGRLLAFAHPQVAGSRHGPEWQAEEHEVTRWCRMLEAHGIPADPSRLDLPAPPVRPPAVAIGATLLHPGAASAARRWPVERWAAVARAERAAGRAVAVTSGPGERARGRAVAHAAGLGPEAVLEELPLLHLAAAVAAAGRVVVGDTGIAHLATALRTPSVVLFGPSAPRLWGPPPGRPWHRALWAGRSGDPHGLVPDPGLLAIGVEHVLQALAALEDVSTTAPALQEAA